MSDFYKLQYSGMTLVYPGGNGFISFEDTAIPRNVILNQQTGGTIAASPMSGYDGDIVTLSNTTNAGYTFNTYNLTGATLTGNQFKFNGSDVTAEPDYTHNVYSVSITQVAGGTVAASPSTGYYGTQVTLSNTPSSEYTFGSYSITGATLTGNKFNFEESNVTAKGSFTRKTYTLTLQTDGHGKLAASKTTGHKGDTVTLTPTYSSYYRFNNYSQTGGSINGNTFTFGSQNATAKANFKVNAFTATGGFEKGSNVTLYSGPSEYRNIKYTTVGAKYATRNASTGAIPASWYSTSNRWHPSNASAYKITINAKMGFSGNNSKANLNGGPVGYVTAVSLLGSTQTQSQTYSHGGKKNAGNWSFAYSKSFTSNSQNINYGLSARLGTIGWQQSTTVEGGARCTYVAANTTGTWTATGYAP